MDLWNYRFSFLFFPFLQKTKNNKIIFLSNRSLLNIQVDEWLVLRLRWIRTLVCSSIFWILWSICAIRRHRRTYIDTIERSSRRSDCASTSRCAFRPSSGSSRRSPRRFVTSASSSVVASISAGVYSSPMWTLRIILVESLWLVSLIFFFKNKIYEKNKVRIFIGIPVGLSAGVSFIRVRFVMLVIVVFISNLICVVQKGGYLVPLEHPENEPIPQWQVERDRLIFRFCFVSISLFHSKLNNIESKLKRKLHRNLIRHRQHLNLKLLQNNL